MSAIRANDGRASVLAPATRGSMIAESEFLTWLDVLLRIRSAVRLPRGTGDRIAKATAQWLPVVMVPAAFTADVCLRGSFAMWLLYAVPLALTRATPRVRQPFTLVAASTAMIVLACFLAPTESSWTAEIVNRAAFAGLLWLAAAGVVRHRAAVETLKHSEARLLHRHEALEQRFRERTAHLEAANRELEAFACSVSHDLRAPLRAVDGFARILEEEHAAQLDGEGRRALDVVRSEARRMSRLIDDLLKFSRLGQQGVQLTDTDMTSLVHEVFDQVKSLAADRQVDFRVGELPTAKADAALLRQVWFNLLDNALKYTRHRPRVQVWITGVKRGAETVYSIRDNGAGFDMKYAGKLFGVFQRLHRADEFEGTGVGLALVQRIIRRHGGRVGAEGHVERGATFYFTLPSSGAGSA
jgi:signal transduction histidine kinase